MPEETWHLDKKVPLALIIVIVIQTAGAIWWASKVTERLDGLTVRLSASELTNRRQYDIISSDRLQSQQTAKQLARVEGLLTSINAQVTALTAHIMNQQRDK